MPFPLSSCHLAPGSNCLSVYAVGPSSQSSPSQESPRRMAPTDSSEDLTSSVSSILKINVPPWLRAKSQLKRAVRAPPMWRNPVGEGAKGTRTFDMGLSFYNMGDLSASF